MKSKAHSRHKSNLSKKKKDKTMSPKKKTLNKYLKVKKKKRPKSKKLLKKELKEPKELKLVKKKPLMATLLAQRLNTMVLTSLASSPLPKSFLSTIATNWLPWMVTLSMTLKIFASLRLPPCKWVLTTCTSSPRQRIPLQLTPIPCCLPSSFLWLTLTSKPFLTLKTALSFTENPILLWVSAHLTPTSRWPWKKLSVPYPFAALMASTNPLKVPLLFRANMMYLISRNSSRLRILSFRKMSLARNSDTRAAPRSRSLPNRPPIHLLSDHFWNFFYKYKIYHKSLSGICTCTSLSDQ